jgi:hypothetical protein
MSEKPECSAQEIAKIAENCHKIQIEKLSASTSS